VIIKNTTDFLQELLIIKEQTTQIVLIVTADNENTMRSY
jgi:hypothetical protein